MRALDSGPPNNGILVGVTQPATPKGGCWSEMESRGAFQGGPGFSVMAESLDHSSSVDRCSGVRKAVMEPPPRYTGYSQGFSVWWDGRPAATRRAGRPAPAAPEAAPALKSAIQTGAKQLI